ncbi:MAG: polysaccharide deacetylase family protein [Actinobacteria bacterium]|nr:polysaccharide deacetylase family protein [Actinomycetota bacterium]
MPASVGGARALRAALLIGIALALLGAASARAGSDGGTVVGASETEAFGCTSTPQEIARRGAKDGMEVALTFDDGPSGTQTPPILETLVRLGARATFFEEGRHVRGHEALMRQILAAGDEIGNHSFHHPVDPGPAELRATNEAIRAATGFEPCLFRPPYGELDRRVKRAALANGLQTVFWTLDSEDDTHPGVGAIRRKVVRQAKPGSIVLLHDGGDHPETVQALPGIVEGLQRRGFRLVTVTELLGGRTLYRG